MSRAAQTLKRAMPRSSNVLMAKNTIFAYVNHTLSKKHSAKTAKSGQMFKDT